MITKKSSIFFIFFAWSTVLGICIYVALFWKAERLEKSNYIPTSYNVSARTRELMTKQVKVPSQEQINKILESIKLRNEEVIKNKTTKRIWQ